MNLFSIIVSMKNDSNLSSKEFSTLLVGILTTYQTENILIDNSQKEFMTHLINTISSLQVKNIDLFIYLIEVFLESIEENKIN
jgi:hypothetical protein